MLSLATPQPLEDAMADIDGRTPIGSVLTSAEWEEMPLALRERAFFSARVAEVRVLNAMKERVTKRIGLLREETASGELALVDRSSFIGDLKKELAEMGYLPERGEEGGLQDLSSARRLGLIFDMNEQNAQGFARWKTSQDADFLDGFPAQELIRLEDRERPREWQRRWVAAGGQLFEGRMIALKNDPVWRAISRFKKPWPPFDYGSGMGVEDVDRFEAEDLGLLDADTVIAPEDVDFNERVETPVKELAPEFRGALKTIFGEQIDLDGDMAVWRGDSRGGAEIGNKGNSAGARKGWITRRRGGPFSEKQNIKLGDVALTQSLRTKRDVADAMHVKGLGKIDFEWGRPGTKKPNAQGATHEDGYGISHIVAKHGRAAAKKLPEVLAKGTVRQHSKDPKKRVVQYGTWLAVVKFKSRTRSYAVTNFDEEEKK